MANLHVDITGDCTGAINALRNTQNEIDRLNGRSAGVAVTVTGTGPTIEALSGVGSALDAVSGATAAIGVNSGGIDAARDSLSGLRSDLDTMTRDFADTGGTRIFGDIGDGGARELVGALAGNVQTLAASASGATSGLQDFRGASISAASDNEVLASAAENAAGRVSQLDDQFVNATMSANKLRTAVGTRGGSSGGSLASDLFGLAHANLGEPLPSTGGPPPPRLGGGGGGGGRGGFGGFEENERGLHEGSGGATGPLMMGTMIGVAADLLTAAGGVMAVNEAIKQTPDLAYAANQAMHQFDLGVRQAAAGAVAEGVPALHELGAALRPLGTEVGRIGAQQMGTVLGGATQLAGDATVALQKLEPAFGPAIQSAVSLGEAILQGVSSPAAVQGIQNVANSITSNQQAISNVIGGIVAASTNVAAGVANAIGDIAGGGGPTSGNEDAAQWMASDSGGLVTANGGVDFGWTGAPLPGQGTGVSWSQGSEVGRVMTALGATGNVVGSTIADIGNGSILGVQGPEAQQRAAQELHQAGDDFNQRWGAALGLTPPPPNGIGPAGGGAGPSGSAFPSGTAPGQFGWNMDEHGNLTPNYQRPGFGTSPQHLPGQAGGITVPQPPAQPTQPGTSTQPFIPHGPGSSAAPMSSAQLQSLGLLNTHMQNLQQSTAQMSSPLQQLQQHAQAAAPPVQQLQQAMPQAVATIQPAIQQIQQVQQQVPQVLQPLQQLPQQAVQQIQQASSVVSSGGVSLGSSVPAAMAQGVQQATPMACDAAANMGDATANCAASAIGAASPATRFIALGEFGGQGLAVGFNNSAGMAAAAAGESAAGALSSAAAALSGALGSGVQAMSDGVLPVASNAGLMVGYEWARNILTGADSVLKDADFTSGSVPDIGSKLAEAVLGQLGYLGPAGSGASFYVPNAGNAGMVTMGTPNMLTPQVNVTAHVQVGDQPIQAVAAKVVDVKMNYLADSISRQRG